VENQFAQRRNWGPSPKYNLVKEYKPKFKSFTVIAGPCSVENIHQVTDLAWVLALNGATHLRGGVFRAGTYPGQNFGFIDWGLIEQTHNVAKNLGLKNIIEVLDYSENSLEKIAQHADCFQVGCRQMQNYQLLRNLGPYKKPVFLKRHPGSTIDEFLGAAEHLLVGGVEELYLIERGSSGNATHVRWDLSVSMIPAIQAITNIPILIDASHGTGRRDLVSPMTLAGVAAGANGVLVEVHNDPENSLSDADQAIRPNDFAQLMSTVRKIRRSLCAV
jgi:3-deoxy-7-phosphoheptulonate synthase